MTIFWIQSIEIWQKFRELFSNPRKQSSSKSKPIFRFWKFDEPYLQDWLNFRKPQANSSLLSGEDCSLNLPKSIVDRLLIDFEVSFPLVSKGCWNKLISPRLKLNLVKKHCMTSFTVTLKKKSRKSFPLILSLNCLAAISRKLHFNYERYERLKEKFLGSHAARPTISRQEMF